MTEKDTVMIRDTLSCQGEYIVMTREDNVTIREDIVMIRKDIVITRDDL